MELTDQQRAWIDRFADNAWYVHEMLDRWRHKPSEVPESWRRFFAELGFTGDGGATLQSSAVQIGPVVVPVMENDSLIPLEGSALRLAENMNTSLSVPTATTLRVIPVRLLEENRRRLNARLQIRGIKISFTHLIAWAMIKALLRHPGINSVYTLMDGKPYRVLRSTIRLGIAVDVERKDGMRHLLVPNIRDCGSLNFSSFVQSYDELVRKTRTGKIDPADFQGTTVSLTNPGTLGTVSSTPRLMAGQGAIIAMGAIDFPAEFAGMSEETLAALGIGKVMTLTSTYDHRIIQGAESGEFLRTIEELLTGGHEFYENIFADLELNIAPIRWSADTSRTQAYSPFPDPEKQQKVYDLMTMYRARGHLAAQLDPLLRQRQPHAELDPAYYGLTIWDYDRVFRTGGLGRQDTATLREILDLLQETYCGHIGVEYRHLLSPEERKWLEERMESTRNRPVLDVGIRRRILQQLIIAETFERFIHLRFPGHKRFSLEGTETLIPVLDHLLNESANAEITEIVIGMAHRGRLNVLGNIVGKWYTKIFAEFEGDLDTDSFQGSGDVKYHLGATGVYHTRHQREIRVTVAPNPSHLEWVNPVVEGIVRAKQSRKKSGWNKQIMAVLIHGDAAFAGQGIVQETLNFSQLEGYKTRGTIHIVVNNQIGFTTLPEESRSSAYATDVAKMIHAPIFHVNADDPEAALWITQLALEYRMRFEKDVVMDLIGFRRHGHNEGDEPGYTQPLMYQLIRQHPGIRSLYADRLTRENLVTVDQVDEFIRDTAACLEESLKVAQSGDWHYEPDAPLAVDATSLPHTPSACPTCIDESVLHRIIESVTRIPPAMTIHPKLQTFLDRRRSMMEGDGAIDWSLAETLAFGSLLLEGSPVRLSGEDSRRGTFSQRHSVLMDMLTGEEYCPLNHLDPQQARFEVVDSLLSEAGILGFEFGYSIADPMTLVLWEAQFGDFANTAQPIIDNFIASCRSKWQLQSGIVLLLPHGQEGQGAEHSSARLERFLQLGADNNLCVANPTTPAQYFHILRLQMHRWPRIPLILMTPKSLLRHPLVRSKKQDFTGGHFAEVIDDYTIDRNLPTDRILLCSGKVYYELLAERQRTARHHIPLIRVEQYYPFPEEALRTALSRYPEKADVFWVQEEPENMGAWSYMALRLPALLSRGQRLVYVGRPPSASPAAGSLKIFKKEMDRFIHEALD